MAEQIMPWEEYQTSTAAPATGGQGVVIPKAEPAPKEPKTSYRLLTPEEVAAQGLPAGSYQVSSEGKVEKVGGEGAAGEKPYSQSALDAFDRAISTADRLLASPGLSSAVGSGFDPASVGRINPLTGEPFAGTQAADFSAELESMKAQVFLPMVQSMKGMGALSNAEGEKLTAAIGALNPNMSEEGFKSSLARIKEDLIGYRNRSAPEGEKYVPPEAEQKKIIGKGEKFLTDQDKALQAALQAAFDAGAGAEQLNSISQGFGRPPLQGIEEAIKARDSGAKGIKATVEPTGTGQENAGAFTAYATGAANALTAGNLDELGGVLGLDPAQIEAGKQYLAEKQGLAYGVGEMSGGAMAMLPVARGAQLAGLGTRAPLAADILYGGAYGAGEQNDSRLGGALLGGAISGVAGSLLRGGARALGGGQIAPEVQASLSDATRAKIPVMTSDVIPPTTFMGKAAQQAGERIPFVGTGPVRATQQDARQEAVKTLLDDYGVGSEGLTETLAKQFSGKRSADVQKYSGMKTEVISSLSGAGEVPLPKANEAIGKEIARLRGLKSAEYAPAIAKLEDWQRSLSGQSIDNIEILRKQIGESFAAPELAAVRSEAQKSLTGIYGPLREDMQSFIRANGGSAAANKWGIANKRLSEMMGELDQRAVKSVLRDVNTTPEQIDRLLFSKKPSEVRALYRALPEEGKATARSAILDRVFKDMKTDIENISPDQFVNRMRERAASTGVFFTGEEAARVNGLLRTLKLSQRAGKAGVMTDTGQQLAPIAGASGLAGIVGAISGGAATGGTVAAGTAATGLAIGVAARILESAPVRNALLRMKASKVGSPEEARAAILVRNAITAAAGQQYQEEAKPAAEAPAPSFTAPGAQQ